MNGSSKMFLILCLIIGSALLFICYLIHIYLIEFKYNVIKKEELLIDDSSEEKEINDEDRI